MPKTIRVADDFTRYPAGRYESDGPFSGEKFRKEFLLPIIKAGETAVVELDGARGYGSSFLEEAFGGLVRDGFSADSVLGAFEIHSSDPSLPMEITDYIKKGGRTAAE